MLLLNYIKLYIPLSPINLRCLFIASIGNPEPEYCLTRHNVGHEFMNQLILIHWKDHIYKDGNYYRSRKFPEVVLYKSNETLMNLQGKFVARHYNRFSLSKLVVFHDELQVKLGKYQIRVEGTSARGHNGLKSVNQYVPSNKYTKFSIGIGKPIGEVSKYVLLKFNQEELEILMWDVFPKLVQELEALAQKEEIVEL